MTLLGEITPDQFHIDTPTYIFDTSTHIFDVHVDNIFDIPSYIFDTPTFYLYMYLILLLGVKPVSYMTRSRKKIAIC